MAPAGRIPFYSFTAAFDIEFMHYALSPRTFLFSHYFYTGLRAAVGIVGLTLAAMLFTDLPVAMSVSIGALCTSLMDLPVPLRDKFNGMLISVVLCSAVTLIISLCTPVHWLLNVMLVLVSFLSCMILVYGRKSMPLQFVALFVMTLSTMSELTVRQSFFHSALFMAGGLGYLAYAMAVSWLQRRRMKQQVLAEALFELARYIDIKAGFYDTRINLTDQFDELVRAQSVLADKQQAARDLILRDWRTGQDPILTQMHFVMLDVYELLLSTHADYALLRKYFVDTDTLPLMQALVGKATKDLESIAFAVTRNAPSHAAIDYQPEIRALEETLQRGGQLPADEARTVLRTSYNKIREVIDMIGKLHQATQLPAGRLPLSPEADMTPFLTRQRYGLRPLLSNLNFQSPVFRFALRVAMAIAVGLLVAQHLPYTSYGYWVVLTIAIILKPSFSMTRRRRSDRVLGTMIGCVLTAVILHFVHAPLVLLAFLFVATAAVSSFVYIKYRYTAIAASMQILLQINLMVPGSEHAIGERLLDTVIGAAIATFFSFVLPSWEYRALPRLTKGVLQANRRYIEAACALLQARMADDFGYRVCRKRFMDSLAELGSALVRMLDEPVSKQRAVEDIHLFIVQNYLVVAHVAAIRLLLRRHAKGLPHEAVNAILQGVCTRVAQTLAQAEHTLERKPALRPAAAESAQAVVDTGSADASHRSWSGWFLLLRRVALLQADADKIAVHGRAIGQALSRSD